jgi:hypothetical protein
MAVVTVYSDAADGMVTSANATYATARSGGTLTADTTGTAITIGQTSPPLYSTEYYCYEGFFGFDTSLVPDIATISTAVLGLVSASDFSFNEFTIEARLYDWSTTVTTADWVAGASLSALTSLATFATSGWATSGYNSFTDVAMPANINKSGFTRIICYSSRHSGNNTPTTLEFVSVYSGDNTGTVSDPKLVITYTLPEIDIKKIAGVPREQIKKINSMANA